MPPFGGIFFSHFFGEPYRFGLKLLYKQ